jgi:hypothetical protein
MDVNGPLRLPRQIAAGGTSPVERGRKKQRPPFTFPPPLAGKVPAKRVEGSCNSYRITTFRCAARDN